MKNLLLPVFEDIECDSQLAVAWDIARTVKGHIAAVFIRPEPISAFKSLPPVIASAGVSAEEIEKEGLNAERNVRKHFDDWCKSKQICRERNDLIDSMVATWTHHVGQMENLIVRFGRVSDLIILNKPDSYEPRTGRAVDAAVFETGRPTLVVPRYAPEGILNHVLVAWNGSLEAARAVAGALTLLRKAERVSVLSIPEEDREEVSDLDVIAALKWHGVNATSLDIRGIATSVGAALLETADNQAVSLLVMGAYTHGRVREMLLGGVTRLVMRNATLPVLMAH